MFWPIGLNFIAQGGEIAWEQSFHRNNVASDLRMKHGYIALMNKGDEENKSSISKSSRILKLFSLDSNSF